ncbi:centriolin-like [Patiria miniata]|uniref:Centriolin n=1 Tax=Patiria miniata TaxID=46514 RepID=A0A914B1E5_PATMI|nr:centriolin-like [Patiria miniata]
MKKSASATRLSEAPELRQSDTSNSLRTTKTQVPSKRKLTLSNATMKAAGTKDDDQHKDSAEKSLVRYINKVMIKKISGKEELRDITTLNLILTTKDNGKKIRYIENLEGLTNLQVLMINHNQISKIENLHHLMRLRELNISCNRINKVEGLETLTHLQTLNLSHNLIETIPAWLAKKLTALRAFHIAGNLLYSLSDVFRLRPLKDLMQLSIADNPLCDLPHHRLFAAFHLRTLQVLDKQTITESERKQADDRFEQEELENLEVQLNNEEKKLRSLQENHSKTLMDQQQSMNLIALLKTKNLAHQQTIIQLHGEVHAKDDLLKRKTAELNKACEKQFRLEQELAFQKIDAKFEPLAFHLDIDEAEGGTEESPYIGKAGYKRNELARQQYFDPSKGQSIRESQQQGQEVLDIDPSPEIQEQLHDVLQDRLTDKQRQIAAAQEQLGKLQDKITDAKKMLDDKNREIQRMSTKSTKRPLSESEKQELKRCLWERLHAVNNLKQRVAELEEAMEASLYIVQIKEREMERLKHQLPNQKHPQYAEAATEISSKEQELTDAGDKYQDLQRELEEIVALLSEEMENVNQVKEQVAQAKVDLNDNLKEELEDAIAGLTTLMQEAQRKAKKEDCKNKFLQRERDPLLGQQQQAEKGKTGLGEDDFMPRDLEDIQRRLAGLQAALAAAEAEKHQLKATLQAEHNSKQAEENETLKAAKEADRLNTALRRQKQQAQLENGMLKKQLYAQRRQVEALRQSIDQSHDCAKNEVVANLLGKLQAQREELEDQLYSQQEQMQEALGALLHPSDVIARISQLQRHLEQGRGKTKPFDDKDILGKSLAELEDLMRERLREKEEACKQQKKAEREADTLRKQMAALKEQLEQVENECARLDVDSPDFSLEEIKVIRQQHNARENIGENKARQEEDAMMEALRGQVRTLQEKLKRHQPHHFVQVESLAKARARQIAQELARAEDKMLKLHQALVDREKLLQQEMQRGDVASQTLATQQIQMDALYDTLEEQKAEILKLHDALNRLVIPKPGMAAAQPSVRDYDIEHLLREIERLNYALQQQEKHMSTQGLLQFGDQPINNLRPTFVGDLQAGLHPIPYTYTSPEQPTGKAADHLQSQTSPIRTYQQYLSPASTHNTVQDFPTNQPTDQQQEFPQSSGHTRPGRILSSVASMMQPVGNTYGQQQAADTQTSYVHVPVLLANAQTFGTTEVQQQVALYQEQKVGYNFIL